MIKVKSNIGIPKYRQIITTIEDSIRSGDLKKGDQIDSINKIRNYNNLSRDTVLNAFNELKSRGIIKSIVGKGYYVNSEDVNVHEKIFLLFDELNAFKEDLYNSFLDHLGPNIQVDIYFHHFNKSIFNKLISDHNGDYNYYVIMPANFKNTSLILEQLPEGQVYILDQLHHDLNHYPAVYQNFESAIHNNLNKALDRIANYQQLILVFSSDRQPIAMHSGFVSFCQDHQISFEIIEDLKDRDLNKGEVYITPEDQSLLLIIQKMKKQELILAKDIGVISYNDTLLKEIVEGGITTISTDFKAMGRSLAEMITTKTPQNIENPNQLIIRKSL